MASYREVYNDGIEKLFGQLDGGPKFKEKSGPTATSVPQEGPPARLVPFSFSGSDVFDETDTMDTLFFVPSVVSRIIEAKIFVAFKEFFAPATAASSGGGSTSGASSTSTSSSGGSSSPTSGSGDNVHSHVWATYRDDSPPALTKREYGTDGNFSTIALEGPPSDLSTDVKSVTHTHSVTIAGHTHDIPHTHSTPAHAHGLTYGVFKEAFPASHSATLTIYLWDGAVWGLVDTIPGFSADAGEVDISPYITVAGAYRLSFQSAAGQPNSGRIGLDLAGYVVGAIQGV